MKFKRKMESDLITWATSSGRMPLLVRGARQVGKSHVIRHFGKEHFRNVIEINFEKKPSLKKIFQPDLSPLRILAELEAIEGVEIKPKADLLFFDEIQDCPEAIVALRYFREELPDLHVVGAGSLLEFVIGNVSIPVGRIEYMYLYPASFSEFLAATNRIKLAQYLPSWSDRKPISTVIADEIYKALKEYYIVGGMPAAVSKFVETKSFAQVAKVQDAIVSTFLDDVHKYVSAKLQLSNLAKTFASVFKFVGQTIKFSTLNPDDDYKRTKKSLELLEKAMLIHVVRSANPNGLPLSAEASEKRFKCAFLDIGLGQRLAGVGAATILQAEGLLSSYQGKLAEQFVAQQLVAESGLGSERGRLYCWMRQEKSASAEVDFLVSRDGKIIPIEIKSGPRGRLKSMQMILTKYNNLEMGICLQHRNDIVQNGNVLFCPLFTLI